MADARPADPSKNDTIADTPAAPEAPKAVPEATKPKAKAVKKKAKVEKAETPDVRVSGGSFPFKTRTF